MKRCVCSVFGLFHVLSLNCTFCFVGGGDGLLGEGPGMGGALFEPMVNSQVNQLMLAQQLLQQQAALGGVGNFGGGDYGMGNFGAMGNARFLQQQRGFIGKGVVRNDRKRVSEKVHET